MSKLCLKLAKNTSPIGYVDVGAGGGLSGTWSTMVPHTKLVGFEPDPEGYEELMRNKKTTDIYINSAVSNDKGLKELYIRNSWGNTSLYKNNDSVINQHPYNSRFDIIGSAFIETDTLDNLLFQHKISNMDFLKVDVEGA